MSILYIIFRLALNLTPRMLARAGFVRAALICGRRFLYSNVKPNSKLLIKCDTPLEVSCLPPCEADRNSVILPDSPTFHVEEGWKITQNSATMPLPYKISSIQIPAYRGLLSVLILLRFV